MNNPNRTLSLSPIEITRLICGHDISNRFIKESRDKFNDVVYYMGGFIDDVKWNPNIVDNLSVEEKLDLLKILRRCV